MLVEITSSVIGQVTSRASHVLMRDCVSGKEVHFPKLPSFSFGDYKPLLLIDISITSSNPHSESNNTHFISNRMTSETPASVNLAASEKFETPVADINSAVSSLVTHVRKSVRTEISPTPNQTKLLCRATHQKLTFSDLLKSLLN